MLGMRSLKGPVSLLGEWLESDSDSLLNQDIGLWNLLVYWIYWIYDDSEYWSIESIESIPTPMWIFVVFFWIKTMEFDGLWVLDPSHQIYRKSIWMVEMDSFFLYSFAAPKSKRILFT